MDNSGVGAFTNWALTSQSKPPHDLLDTVYPNEVLDYWVSSYLLECITRGCNQHHLCVQLRDMQYHVLNCYEIAAPSLYDLPHIEQMWKISLVEQLQPSNQQSNSSTNLLTVALVIMMRNFWRNMQIS